MVALLQGGYQLGCLDLSQLRREKLGKASYTCSGSACLILKVSTRGIVRLRSRDSRRKRIWIVAAVVGHHKGL